MNSDDFKYDGQVTITLALHGDEISVWPSNESKGGVAISLLDSQEPRTNVGIASPAEWDAFVAAGNAALGRSPHPDAARIVKAIVADLSDRRGLRHEWGHIDDDIRDEIVAKWTRIVEDGMGGREAGPTVPRAAVEALRARLCEKPLAMLCFQSSGYARDASLALKRALDEIDALLAAPTTPPEKDPGHADD